jgi:hypothetical protein
MKATMKETAATQVADLKSFSVCAVLSGMSLSSVQFLRPGFPVTLSRTDLGKSGRGPES